MVYKDSFLRYLKFEKRYSSNTVLSYCNDLSQFYSFCGQSVDGFDAINLDYKVIRRWIVYLMENNLSPRTVNRKISTLKSFYKFLLREKLIRNNPLDKVITPKISKKLPSFVEKDQMDILLDNLDFGQDFTGVRNKLIIEMFYLTGMRLSELINLKNIDIDSRRLTIKVLGKRNKERIIPFSKGFKKAIENYIHMKEEKFNLFRNDYFFLTEKGNKIYEKLVYRMVNKYLQLITTLEKKSPHVLRHSFATHM